MKILLKKVIVRYYIVTKEYIKVASVRDNTIIRFYDPLLILPDNPKLYSAEWYIRAKNSDVLVEYIPQVFIQEITVDRKEPQASPSYYVTGYVDDKGKVIQFVV